MFVNLCEHVGKLVRVSCVSTVELHVGVVCLSLTLVGHVGAVAERVELPAGLHVLHCVAGALIFSDVF